MITFDKRPSMSEPTLTSKCSQSGCEHPLAVHWESYDGFSTGCGARAIEHQGADCTCRGFVSVYRRPRPELSRSDGEAYYQR